ncbi:MAG: RIP homotypic interaction motif-containing protein [Pseudomonadota bacterium]
MDTRLCAILRTTFSTWSSSLVKPRAEQRTTTININNSQGIQIGDHNIQHIASSLSGLLEMIESSDSRAEDKEAAKGTLRKFLENPSVAAVLGAATSGLLALLP